MDSKHPDLCPKCNGPINPKVFIRKEVPGKPDIIRARCKKGCYDKPA